jgi:hypothetical protein
MQEYKDLAESFEGEEGETTTLPLLGAWWALIFNLLLAWEYCTSYWEGEASII